MSETEMAQGTGNQQFEGLIECGACKTYNYRTSKFCLYCGTDLKRRCDRCGSEAADPLAHYCTECGNALSRTTDKR